MVNIDPKYLIPASLVGLAAAGVLAYTQFKGPEPSPVAGTPTTTVTAQPSSGTVVPSATPQAGSPTAVATAAVPEPTQAAQAQPTNIPTQPTAYAAVTPAGATAVATSVPAASYTPVQAPQSGATVVPPTIVVPQPGVYTTPTAQSTASRPAPTSLATIVAGTPVPATGFRADLKPADLVSILYSGGTPNLEKIDRIANALYAEGRMSIVGGKITPDKLAFAVYLKEAVDEQGQRNPQALGGSGNAYEMLPSRPNGVMFNDRGLEITFRHTENPLHTGVDQRQFRVRYQRQTDYFIAKQALQSR